MVGVREALSEARGATCVEAVVTPRCAGLSKNNESRKGIFSLIRQVNGRCAGANQPTRGIQTVSDSQRRGLGRG